MTWTELNRYGDYKLTERALVARLEDVEEQKREKTVKDTVSGSMREFPYVKRVVKIEGLDEAELERLTFERIQAETALVNVRRKMRSIEDWVSRMRDPFIREITKRRILEGRRWEEVSMVLTEGRVSGDCLRMQFSKYVRKHPRG